jgi:HAD superfamily hydrolase (TIGR01509 family)
LNVADRADRQHLGMIRAVVFDFDGLLCDTESHDLKSWQDVFAAHGVELPLTWWHELVGSAGGRRPDDVLFDLIGEFDRDAVRSARRDTYLQLVDAAPLCEGVLEWLQEAMTLGLSIGLATSSPRSWIDRHLPRLGVAAYFDCVRTRDDVDRAKPAPDLYAAVVDALGVRPCDAVAVEDSPNGVLAARRAGLKTVAVPNAVTAGLAFDGPDVQLDSLLERSLAEVVAEVG